MRIDHVANVCRDAAATTRFYGELLGLPPTRFEHDGADMLMFALPAGGALVFTVAGGGASASAPTAERDWQHRHLGLTVATAAELDAWITRLRAHGVPHQWIDNERLYFADPDGLVLELEVAR